MLIYKSGRNTINEAVNVLQEKADRLASLTKKEIKVGFILRHNKTNYFDTDFYIDNVSLSLNNLGLSEADLNHSQVVFSICAKGYDYSKVLNVCDKLKNVEARVSLDSYLKPLATDLENIVLFGTNTHLPAVENDKTSDIKDYTLNFLNGFSAEALENKIQFFGKYNAFVNVSFILCNKNTGFKFMGKFENIKGEKIKNGDILNHRGIVIETMFNRKK